MEEKKSMPSFEPAKPRRMFPTVGDVLALLGIAFAAQILVGLVVTLVLTLTGVPYADLQTDSAFMGKFLAGTYFLSMSVALLAMLFYRRQRGGRGRWAQFSTRRLNPVLLLWAFLLILAIGVVLEPLMAVMPDINLPIGRGFWTVVSLCIFAPIFEELICRGVVLGSLRAKYGTVLALIISSLFFGILHFQPAQVISAAAIGLILGYIYIVTESLWASMILHALNNALAYLLLVSVGEEVMLYDLISNRALYALAYAVALAVAVGSGFMIFRTLRKIRETEKNEVAA